MVICGPRVAYATRLPKVSMRAGVEKELSVLPELVYIILSPVPNTICIELFLPGVIAGIPPLAIEMMDDSFFSEFSVHENKIKNTAGINKSIFFISSFLVQPFFK